MQSWLPERATGSLFQTTMADGGKKIGLVTDIGQTRGF